MNPMKWIAISWIPIHESRMWSRCANLGSFSRWKVNFSREKSRKTLKSQQKAMKMCEIQGILRFFFDVGPHFFKNHVNMPRLTRLCVCHEASWSFMDSWIGHESHEMNRGSQFMSHESREMNRDLVNRKLCFFFKYLELSGVGSRARAAELHEFVTR